MFTDTAAKTLSHIKTLIISKPRYSVRAQHPHLKVREVGTHPREHTESVTTLPGPDFICPCLKVTADNCAKASAVFPHAYICLLDPSWGDNAQGGDTCGCVLTNGGRNVSGEWHSWSQPHHSCSMTSWKKPFLLLCFYLLFQVLQNYSIQTTPLEYENQSF